MDIREMTPKKHKRDSLMIIRGYEPSQASRQAISESVSNMWINRTDMTAQEKDLAKSSKSIEMMKTIPKEAEAKVPKDEGAKRGRNAPGELLPHTFSADKPPLASVGKTFSSGSQVASSLKLVNDIVSPSDKQTNVHREIKSPPTLTKDAYSEFLDKNMQDRQVALPGVDEAFPQSVNPFNFKILSPEKEGNPAPKRSPESHIGKHLTFASQITVAELKNDAIVEHNNTANFNETMVSPMFLEKKGSEGSPEASVPGSSDV